MVLEHYKTELELAQYVSKLEAQVKGYKALCERLQAQADEMRGGRECRCTMRQKLVGDGCSVCNPEYAADHLPDATEMVVPEGWQLVPIEPTPEMMLHNSGCKHHAADDPECPNRRVRRNVWAQMLAVAPTPTNGVSHD